MLSKISLQGNNKFSKYALEEFYQQKPNRKFFFLPFRPYVHAYYYGEKIHDTTNINYKYNKKIAKLEQKISSKNDSISIRKLNLKKDDLTNKKQLVLKDGNWLMRYVGEKLSIYDSTSTFNTAAQMQKYLHSKGHFRSEVKVKVKVSNKKVKVKYLNEEKSPYIIASNKLICADKTISKLLKSDPTSLINKSSIYTDALLSNERMRITDFLKSEGYFNFHQRYILFEIDSTIEKNKVYIKTIINNPKEGNHEKFTIKNVYFTTDAGSYNISSARDTFLYKNIYYLWKEKNVSEKILDRKIRITPGELYNHNLVLQTQKNIADLNMYKFVNINFYEVNDSAKNELNCLITTSIFQKYQVSTEFGVNVFQSLPGPFGNLAIKSRNLLTGSEIIDINVRAGIEGQTSILFPNTVLTTQEFGSNALISFPKFFLPSSILRKYNDYNPKTQFKLGASLTKRIEFARDNLTTSYAYMWQKTKNTRYIVTPLELTLINTRNETELFKSYIQELRNNNNPLFLSFRRSIISSIRYDFIFDNNLNKQKKQSRYFRLSLESGGTGLNFIQKNILNNQSNTLFGLDYYQFLRGFTDFRYYIPTKNKNIVATRMSIGIAKTVNNTESLPYEKYFFTGGSYSNRAWLPRRLGPGSYTPLNANGEFDKTYRIEQPGEILFESNIEYRFRIKGVLDGALFTDIGNVWTINDDARPGSLFNTDKFFTEFAVGAGFGFRFDFSFLILRLDLGSKIWDPALDLPNRFIPKNNNFVEILLDRRLTIINLGIGYPF